VAYPREHDKIGLLTNSVSRLVTVSGRKAIVRRCVLQDEGGAMQHPPCGRVCAGSALAGASSLFGVIHRLGKILGAPARMGIGGAATRDRI
jgi:hypothetical protein